MNSKILKDILYRTQFTTYIRSSQYYLTPTWLYTYSFLKFLLNLHKSRGLPSKAAADRWLQSTIVLFKKENFPTSGYLVRTPKIRNYKLLRGYEIWQFVITNTSSQEIIFWVKFNRVHIFWPKFKKMNYITHQ
jgi:hypothetical protein